MYSLHLIESALAGIMDDGWGKPFAQFDDDDKQEVIDAVIKAFNDDGMFILRDKYVVTGKSGVLSAKDFKITKWQPIETAPKDETEILLKIPLQWEEPQGRIGSGDYVSAYWYDESSVLWMNRLGHWISLDRPTHWMPLPEPPETNHE